MLTAFVSSLVSDTISPEHCSAFDSFPATFFVDICIGVSSLSGLIPLYAGVSPSILSTRRFSSLKYAILLTLPVRFFFQAVFFLRATLTNKCNNIKIFAPTDHVLEVITHFIHANDVFLENIQYVRQASTCEKIHVDETKTAPP